MAKVNRDLIQCVVESSRNLTNMKYSVLEISEKHKKTTEDYV